MKFNISTNSMKKILSNVSKLTNIKSTNRLYTSVKLEVLENKLIVFAQNNIESIEIIETNIEIFSEGTVVIESKILHDLVKNIDDVSLEFQLFDESLLNIKTLNSSYQINVLNISPNELTNQEIDFDLVIESEELIKLIKYNIYAIDNSGINPIISGLNLKLEKDKISSFSTDGFRLTNSFLDINNEIINDVIIYKKSAKDIISLIEENSIKNVSIKFENDLLILGLDRVILKLKLIDGKYPTTADIKKYLNESQISIPLNKSKLENIIKRLMIFSNDESKSIIVSVENNKILFENENNMFGNGVESINIELVIDQPFNLLVSGMFLSETLKNCSDEIILTLENDVSPIIIHDEKYNTSHLITPLNM